MFSRLSLSLGALFFLALLLTALSVGNSQAVWFLPRLHSSVVNDSRAHAFGGASLTAEESGTEQESGDIRSAAPIFAPINAENEREPGQTAPQPSPYNPSNREHENERPSDTLDDLEFALALLKHGSGGQIASVKGNPDLDLARSPDNFDRSYDLLDAAIQPALATFPIVAYIEVEAGDTLSSLFQEVGISIKETQQAGNAINQVFNLSRLRPGQVLELELNGAIEPYTMGRLQRISFAPTTLEQIVVVGKNGLFESRKSEIARNRVLIHASGMLETGYVYVDGAAMDIDGSMIANFVNALDAQIDFSRIQSAGDQIEMIYEAYFDDKGSLVDAGNVIYAAFNDQGGDLYEAFRFENNNKAAYFTRDARFTGQTNTLMRKPLGGGRLSSPFGMRTHPVSGDGRMHHGVDYAASCGTPVYAAGDGILTFVDWKGGYGRFAGIKHGPTFTTHYAHLKSFANGMRPGVRVRKGQLIGRVGTTGVSTGCHLHYEVVRSGRKINPLSEHIPRGADLDTAGKARFLTYVDEIDSERSKAITISKAINLAKAGTYSTNGQKN